MIWLWGWLFGLFAAAVGVSLFTAGGLLLGLVASRMVEAARPGAQFPELRSKLATWGPLLGLALGAVACGVGDLSGGFEGPGDMGSGGDVSPIVGGLWRWGAWAGGVLGAGLAGWLACSPPKRSRGAGEGGKG